MSPCPFGPNTAVLGGSGSFWSFRVDGILFGFVPSDSSGAGVLRVLGGGIDPPRVSPSGFFSNDGGVPAGFGGVDGRECFAGGSGGGGGVSAEGELANPPGIMGAAPLGPAWAPSLSSESSPSVRRSRSRSGPPPLLSGGGRGG